MADCVTSATTVTVHLADKTTRKALNRLKKLEPEVLSKKIETTQERAAQLTIKLVRARKELQDLKAAKTLLDDPNHAAEADVKRKRKPAAEGGEAPKPKKVKTAPKVAVVAEKTDEEPDV